MADFLLHAKAIIKFFAAIYMTISILMTVFFMCLRENIGRLIKRKGKSEEGEGDLLGSTASTDDTDNSNMSDANN